MSAFFFNTILWFNPNSSKLPVVWLAEPPLMMVWWLPTLSAPNHQYARHPKLLHIHKVPAHERPVDSAFLRTPLSLPPALKKCWTTWKTYGKMCLWSWSPMEKYVIISKKHKPINSCRKCEVGDSHSMQIFNMYSTAVTSMPFKPLPRLP